MYQRFKAERVMTILPHCYNAALNILAMGLHGMGSIPRSSRLKRGEQVFLSSEKVPI